MEKERFERASAIAKEITDTKIAIGHYDEYENRMRGFGIKMTIVGSEPLGFKLPKESTDMFLSMARSVLENKLNQLEKEFEEL